MPSLKGHLVTAVAVTGLALYYDLVPSLMITPSMGVGIVIGTILPDLDCASSTVNQKILIINRKWFQILVYALMSAALVYYLGTEFKVLLAASLIFITGFLPHRKFTHKFTGVALISLALYLFLGVNPLSIGIVLGMVVHVVIDKFFDLF